MLGRTWTGSGRNDIDDDCGVRYLRGGKMCRRGSEPRRKLVRWQRLMISAGWLARFKSRPRLYPRGILPRICPSLFAALSRHRRRTGLPECHEPVNPFVSLTNRLLAPYRGHYLWKIVRSSLEMKHRKYFLFFNYCFHLLFQTMESVEFHYMFITLSFNFFFNNK